MEVGLGTAEALSAPADLLAVGVDADLEPGPGAEQALEALGTPLRPLLESRGFSGKTGEAVALPTLGRLRALATNLARDLSNEPANNLHPDDLAAVAARAVEGKGVRISVKDERE